MTTPSDTATTTLASWLLAHVVEDEYDARAFVNELGDAKVWRCDSVGGNVREVGPTAFGLPDVIAGAATHMHAAHIARHDPARVLADCAVSRSLRPTGLPWIGRRWLSVLLVPFGRRRG